MNAGRQRGAVLIMVLWTAVVLTVLVTVLAANIRLSASTALIHREGVQGFADVMSSIYKAEMELMMERMPLPAAVTEQSAAALEGRMPAYRFNGQRLNLHYPLEEGMSVRIYDHAGKINLNRIPRQRLQRLIEHWLGPNYDPRQLQELLAAWADWTDLNELPTPAGAENEYYLALDPPYTARNSQEFDTVEELRLIRGFDELLRDVNLEAAFTIYGRSNSLNPNLATREALLLLPGMDAESVERIIALREQQDIRSMREIGDVVPLEKMVELSPWLGFDTSSVYSVFAYVEPQEEAVTQAYMQIMEVRDFSARARIHKVHPYARLPDTEPARTALRN